MKQVLVFSLTCFLVSVCAWAGDCVMTVDRTPCPGKETAAFKPYNGKNPTEEKKVAKDEAACTALAEKNSKIVRKGTLAEKKVKATFDGAAIAKEFSDKAECTK